MKLSYKLMGIAGVMLVTAVSLPLLLSYNFLTAIEANTPAVVDPQYSVAKFISTILIASLALAAIWGIVWYFAIKRLILTPLYVLSTRLGKICGGANLQDLPIAGSDEISLLYRAANELTRDAVDFHQRLHEETKEQTEELFGKVKDLELIKRATINILEDLNEEKSKIEVSKAKDEAVLSSIGDGLIVVDNNLKIQLANHQTEKLLGWSTEEILGKNWAELIQARSDGENSEILYDQLPINIALKTKTMIKRDDIFYKRKSGIWFPASMTASPISINGVIRGAVLVFRDITHEKEVDKAKTEFVSLASHQLRTPLSAINWYAEMLMAGDAGSLSKDQKEYLKAIYESNQRMVELVDAILNVSRIDLGTLAIENKQVNFQEICESVIHELMPKIEEKSLNLKTDYRGDLVNVNGDERILRIIVQNLLSNATKYTPDRGHIRIMVSLNKSNLEIEVADDGYGIPEIQQERVFSKLFRADNAREKCPDGTGLGLYIVKSVVTQCNGKIWFDSEENKGTTFHVMLPVVSKSVEPNKSV